MIEKIKNTLLFRIPTFLAWVLTRPIAYIWEIDYRSVTWISLAVTIYAYLVNNKILTLISGLIFVLVFLKAEYERGEWLHWWRERFKKKAMEEAKQNESQL